MTQTHPKALLAYSSVSQMGLAAVGVGVGLAAAGKSAAVMTAVALFAAHHAFAKGALFLGTGLAACETSARNRRLLAAGLAVCGAALAGFPLTGGMAAKGALKYLVAGVEMPWSSLLEWLLPLTGITTMLLMIRFLCIAVPRPREPHGAWNLPMFVPWAVLVSGVLVLPWLALGMGWVGAKQAGLYPAGAWQAAWPPLVAAVIAGAVWNTSRVMGVLSRIRIPPGDVLSVFLVLMQGALAFFRIFIEPPSRMIQGIPSALLAQWKQRHGNLLQRIARYENFALGMLLMAALALGMAWMLWP
ncbi:MAG TPA: hypothetical protein ENN65_02855 [Candidatus Hydrogenedentes bacterium]|nr:hypothetical protein [Candidatus Hydrogenedentota bacterium]